MVNLSAKKLKAAVTICRPIHWVKNFGMFAPLILTGGLANETLFLKVFWGFLAFNLASSATYAFNDTIDAPQDRLHPIKKDRPVAKGTLSPAESIFLALVLALSSLLWSYALSYIFFLLIISYLLIQVAYSLYLKNLAIIDILVIASGFIIRVFSGAFIINAHLSVWFLLCVVSLALFLASGKRRAELGIVGSSSGTRKSLSKYSPELLNSFVTMFGNAAWMSWALFTFFESPQATTPVWLFLAELSRTTTINKLLMVTIPITIFGIMRYQSLIFEGRAETPEKLLLSDKSLVASVLLWAAIVIWVLYSGIATF